MSEVKVVEDQGPDPKEGKSRPSSDTQFPYYDLRHAVDVAKTLHEKAGGRCDRDQLAVLIGHSSTRSGAFLSKISAVKMFGLIEEGSDSVVRITGRGKRIVAPVKQEDAQSAKVEAFLDVELFRKIYEEFKSTTLPDEVGLKNLLKNEYGIVESRLGATVRILLDSAEYAGFFEMGGGARDRLVKPVITPKDQADEAPAAVLPPDDRQDNGIEGETKTTEPVTGGGGSGSGGGGEGDIDPAIYGLLQRLPASGTPLSDKRRKALIDAFTSLVNFIYPEADEQ